MPLLEGALLSAVTLAFTLITKRAKKAAKKKAKANRVVPPKDDSAVEERIAKFVSENIAELNTLEFAEVADPPKPESAPPKTEFKPILDCEVEVKDYWTNWYVCLPHVSHYPSYPTLYCQKYLRFLQITW